MRKGLSMNEEADDDEGNGVFGFVLASLSLAIMPSLAIIPSLVIISLEKLESLDSMMSGRIMSCCPGRIISL